MESLSDSPTLSDALSASTPEPAVGWFLGPYELVEKLGEGGMGVVFRARNQRDNTFVALKTIRPKLAGNATIRQRFLDEAANMRRLSHPHIVRVNEIVDDPVLGPHYTMPLATGSLAGAAKPMPEAELLRHGIAVAEALWYAHKTGALIHRDVKPENVLIDAAGQAMLSDFGIGRSLWNEILPAAANVNWRVGTPRFMAPEIANGEPGDTHADIYSLGALLYDLATGKTPYTGATADEILLQLRLGPPPRVRDVNPSVSPNLATVIEGAMARALRDRYAEMGDVVEDLRRIQAGHAPRGPHGNAGANQTNKAATATSAQMAPDTSHSGSKLIMMSSIAAAVVAGAIAVPVVMHKPATPVVIVQPAPQPEAKPTKSATPIDNPPQPTIVQTPKRNDEKILPVDPFAPLTNNQQTLAQPKADPTPQQPPTPPVQKSPAEPSAAAKFLDALNSNNAAALNALINDKSFDANKPISSGKLPLFLAIQRDRPDLVGALLSAGANPNLRQDGKTAMYVAAEQNRPNLIRVLHDKGLSVDVPNDTTRETPLAVAVHRRNADAVKALVALGADADRKDARGKSPRTVAAESSPEMLPLLPAK